MSVYRIVSGGQTGVDRAALDFAIEHGIAYGGWIPKGRLSEDGQVPDRYQMTEHYESGYPPRTEANVRDSDATAIFVNAPLNSERGALLTASLCLKIGRPYTVLHLEHVTVDEGALVIKTLLDRGDVWVLNVAGARGSRRPDTEKVRQILAKAMIPQHAA